MADKLWKRLKSSGATFLSNLGSTLSGQKELSEEELEQFFDNVDMKDEDGVTVVQVPVYDIHVNKKMKVRSCVLGVEEIAKLLHMRIEKERTIMFVGETGSGKSTMVQLLLNYFMKIEFKNSVRLSMVDEQQSEHKSPADSQTEWVTLYKICPTKDQTRCPFMLNVIDTPGFADTRGVSMDVRIVEQIKELFENAPSYGFNSLNAVCCTIKAPTTRQTSLQKYIANQILGVFHHDVKQHIYAAITFSDGTKKNLPALQIWKEAGFEISDEHVLLFNNDPDIYKKTETQSKDDEDLMKHHIVRWDMNMKYCKKLVESISKKQGTTVNSIQKHVDVLKDRELLHVRYANIKMIVEISLRERAALKKIEAALIKYQRKSGENRDNVLIKTTEKLIYHGVAPNWCVAINCEKCKRTCHHPCSDVRLGDDTPNCLRLCDRFKVSELCSVCRCLFTDHHTSNQYIVVEIIEEVVVDEQKRTDFEQAEESVRYARRNIEEMQRRLEQIKADIIQAIRDCRRIYSRICKNALRKPCDGQLFIAALIKEYRDLHAGDCQENIVFLQGIHDDVQLMKVITHEDVPFDVAADTLTVQVQHASSAGTSRR